MTVAQTLAGCRIAFVAYSPNIHHSFSLQLRDVKELIKARGGATSTKKDCTHLVASDDQLQMSVRGNSKARKKKFFVITYNWLAEMLWPSETTREDDYLPHSQAPEEDEQHVADDIVDQGQAGLDAALLQKARVQRGEKDQFVSSPSQESGNSPTTALQTLLQKWDLIEYSATDSNVQAACVDWLISFANSDWSQLGSLCLYEDTRAESQALIKSFKKAKVNRQLKGYLEDTDHPAQLRRKLEHHRKQPHAWIFSVTLDIIHRMKPTNMSHDLQQACLIVLYFINNSVACILDADGYTSDVVDMLLNLRKETPEPMSDDVEVNMPAPFIDWLISFANSDWDRMGSFCRYWNAHAESRALVKSYTKAKVNRQLKSYLEDIHHTSQLRRKLQHHREQPHAWIFFVTLYTIQRTRLTKMTHDLRQACLIVLMSVHRSYVDIVDTDKYTTELTKFHKILRKETPDWRWSTSDKTVLKHISWDIRTPPYFAKKVCCERDSDDDEDQPIGLCNPLFQQDVMLYVSNRTRKPAEPIPIPGGSTVYYILKAIHGFYGKVGAKYDETDKQSGEGSDSHKNRERHDWYMGDQCRLQGIYGTRSAPLRWYVRLYNGSQ